MLIQNYTSRWGTSRLSVLFKENVDKNCNFIEKVAFQFCYGSLVPKHTYELTNELIGTYKKYTLISPGDIVLNGLNLNYDFVTQRVAFVEKAGIITSAYICLRPRATLNNKYYAYLFKALDFKKVFNGLGTGIRLTLSYKDLRNYDLPVPPRDEQDQIVRFLDWKVSAINRLINIKKKEIKDIEALKKSLIDDCVTHGLNPDVPMKDSGVKWLGQIPAHWKTIKIKYLFKERVDKGHPNKPMLVASQNMGVVPKYVYGSRTVEAMKDLQLLKLVKVGDFVISLRSFQGGIERAYYEGIISPAYTIMIPGHQIESGYFRYLAKSVSFIELLKLCVTGIREGQNIDYNKLKNNLLLVPPLDEQALISKFLDSKLKNYDNIRIYLQKQIGSLNELKSRLISDAVTGQIDVRDVEIPSFDMVEEDLEEEKLENNDETEENGEVE